MKTVALAVGRVVPRRPDTAAHFARGAAIEPATFAEQMRWLAERFEFVTPRTWWLHRTRRLGGGDRVILTVDGGYRDVVDHIDPICRALRIRYAIYPIAGHTAESPVACWLDVWCDLVARADWRPGLDLSWAGARAEPPDPAVDLRWWAAGPIAERLGAAGPAERRALLAALGDALRVAPDPALAGRLYCGRATLGRLADAGVEIGGHGRWHRRMTAVDPAAQLDELGGARALLAGLGAQRPWSFCYPGGHADAEVARRVAAVGFATAFTAEPGAIDPTCDLHRLPRYALRDRPPGAPGWCDAFEPGAALRPTG